MKADQKQCASKTIPMSRNRCQLSNALSMQPGIDVMKGKDLITAISVARYLFVGAVLRPISSINSAVEVELEEPWESDVNFSTSCRMTLPSRNQLHYAVHV